MELIDWGTVLKVVVAGAVIVSATWLAISLGTVLIRGRQTPVERTEIRRPARPAPRPGAVDHAGDGGDGHPLPGASP